MEIRFLLEKPSIDQKEITGKKTAFFNFPILRGIFIHLIFFTSVSPVEVWLSGYTY